MSNGFKKSWNETFTHARTHSPTHALTDDGQKTVTLCAQMS